MIFIIYGLIILVPNIETKNNLYHLGSLKKLCCTSIEWSYSKDNYLNDNLYHFWCKVSKNVLNDIKRISGNPNRLRRILKNSRRHDIYWNGTKVNKLYIQSVHFFMCSSIYFIIYYVRKILEIIWGFLDNIYYFINLWFTRR